MKRPSILVIDSDLAVRRYLRRRLTAAGYDIRESDSAASAIKLVANEPPDAIILAMDLPRYRRFPLINELRTLSPVPILALLPARSERGAVEALDSGANDCVAKPFALGELAARIRKLLRHAVRQRGGVAAFSSGGLEVDLARGSVSLHGRPIKLSQQEFDVLGLLVRADEAVLTYREILERVWGPSYGERVEYLRRTINHLRRKIEPDPQSPAYLTNATRVGYRLTRGPSASPLTGVLRTKERHR